MATGANSFFNENGYYVAKRIFNASEVQSLETEFDKIVAQLNSSGEDTNARWNGPQIDKLESAGSQIVHTHNVQSFSAVWTGALFHPRFLDCASEILGPDIILHHTKLFQKPPLTGSPFPVHQDWSYFPCRGNAMIAAIIHVSKATDEMGCLRVYPGSHKLGRIDNSSGQVQNNFLDRYPLVNATPVEAEPGDVVFFHYLTLHGSRRNSSLQTRKTVLVQLYAGHDELENDRHHNERLTLRGWNSSATRNTVNRGKALHG